VAGKRRATERDIEQKIVKGAGLSETQGRGGEEPKLENRSKKSVEALQNEKTREKEIKNLL